eukprot:CAMPEP_0197640320 /NCGR_PEP_ID=MMETSP1338-20131121/14654_1 /TAXON_ID=43686 ORGANISM="Pelagodinium beii, Strain RCC1491" /NCGR_SAMPLE_ID=MMETSP1338 /ASSEMBLY_ACC=CAM_ASM_000754 /LENGTH=63 /DNA_ID=CAMNT_0043213157 /DNA_START=38 /DNA_END=226 /DNA_ORIENTATION=+
MSVLGKRTERNSVETLLRNSTADNESMPASMRGVLSSISNPMPEAAALIDFRTSPRRSSAGKF